LIRFHRKEQMQKLRSILGSVLTLKRVNSFQPKPRSESR
jgi:hypothetical protein